MPAVNLTSHPSTPCPAISAFTVHCERITADRLALSYRLAGAMESLILPGDSTRPARRNELWRHTCCELFIAAGAGPDYWECNMSPSGDWAVYRFTAYREGMSSPPLAGQPAILAERGRRQFTLRVTLDIGALDLAPASRDGIRLAIAAVIETREGALSYWALRHPPGRPNFHHPDSFVLVLTA